MADEYLLPADFREGTALWSDIVLGNDVVSDTRLTTEILEQQREFDRLTRDHFLPITGANLTFPGSGMTLLLTPGYRLTAATTVSVTAPGGSPVALTASQYRLRAFGIERLDGVPFRPQDTVTLTGTSYGWSACPYQVKRAVALMVYDSIRGSKGRHHAVKWSTANVEYEADAESQTGLPEVDRIVKRFRVPRRVI